MISYNLFKRKTMYGMVWYGMVWYGMVWYGMVWYGMVWCSRLDSFCLVCLCVRALYVALLTLFKKFELEGNCHTHIKGELCA
jgi:hypothetical protein